MRFLFYLVVTKEAEPHGTEEELSDSLFKATVTCNVQKVKQILRINPNLVSFPVIGSLQLWDAYYILVYELRSSLGTYNLEVDMGCAYH